MKIKSLVKAKKLNKEMFMLMFRFNNQNYGGQMVLEHHSFMILLSRLEKLMAKR